MREALFAAAYGSTDDAERLVLADWLEQHGEVARAQAIHLQCELARTGPFERRRQEVAWELEAVLAELGDRWTDDLPVLDGVTWVALDRGLPHAVRVRDAETLYAHADAIHRAAPTVSRVIFDELRTATSKAKIPWMRAARVLGRPYHASILASVRVLELDGDGDHGDLSVWPALESVTISNNPSVGNELAEALAGGAWTNKLRVVRMPTTRAEGPASYYDQDPRMTAAGAARLLELDTLETLQIDRHLPGVKNVERMLALPNLRDFTAREVGLKKKLAVPKQGAPFTALDLSSNPIGSAVVQALARSPRMVQLDKLVLDTCEVEAMALDTIVKSPMWQTLQILDLSRNPLGKAGARYLADAPPPARLHTLRLADVDFDDGCGAILGKTRWLGRLLELDLTGNRFGRGLAGLRELEVDGLRKLSLASIGMERTEAAVLSKLWPRLVHLAIGDNAIGDAGIERFATTKEAPALQSLALWKCNLTDDGLELLARARCPRLRVLELWGNRLTGAGLAMLLGSPVMRHVGALDLRHCELDTASIRRLAATPMTLHTLDLRANELTEEALMILAESTALRGVKRIRLDGNPYTFEPRNRDRLAERFGAAWFQDDP